MKHPTASPILKPTLMQGIAAQKECMQMYVDVHEQKLCMLPCDRRNLHVHAHKIELEEGHVGLVPLLTGSVERRGSLAEVRGGVLDGLASILGQILRVLLQVDVCTDNIFAAGLLVYLTDTCSLATICRDQCTKQATNALSGQEKFYKCVQSTITALMCSSATTC